jgi:flagellar protein FlaJ
VKTTKYSSLCLRVFERFFIEKKKAQLAERIILLEKANINMVYEEYLSIVFMNILIGIIIAIILAFLLYWVKPYTYTLLLFPILPALVSLYIWQIYQYLPSYYIKKRVVSIDRFLPYAVNFISTMSVAGVSPAEIFRNLSMIDVYGELQIEAKKIVKEIDMMGIDNITTLKNAIEYTPSKKFKAFLQGMIGTIQSGSSLHTYLSNVVENYMEEEFLARKKDLDLLSIIAETFVISVIAFPIFLVIILSVMGFFGRSTGFTIDLLFIFSFLVLPMAYAGFYVLIKSTSLEEMKKIRVKEKIDFRQYYEKNKSFIFVILFTACLLFSFYFTIYVLSYYGYVGFINYLYLDVVFLTVIILIGPIGFYAHRQVKKIKEIQERLPDFLVEIGNSVSSGMTVFEAIKIASKGSYGRLTNEIRKMKAELSWHTPVTTVFNSFSDRMGSAIIKRIVVTTNKGLMMGGDAPKIFNAAAKEIGQVNRIEEQKKTDMSIYTIVILVSFFVFLGIILILNRTIFTAFFETQREMAWQSISLTMNVNAIDSMLLNYALYSFVFIQSIGAGLLGGFMMDGKLSSGVRYSFILGLTSIFVFKFLF